MYVFSTLTHSSDYGTAKTPDFLKKTVTVLVGLMYTMQLLKKH